MKKTIVLISIFGSLTVCSFQLYKWQEFSFEATWLQIKSFISIATIHDLTRLGALANSKNLIQDSNEAFLMVLHKDPLNMTAYANLAINNSKTKPFEKAIPYFENYFALSGNAKDVLHAYALLQSQIKGPESATKFYLQALNGSLSKDQYLKDYYSNLIELNQPWQAITYIASIYQGDLTRASYWLHQIQKEILRLNKGQNKLEVFATARDEFYLPIKFNKNQRYQFIKYDSDNKYFMLNSEYIKEHKIILQKTEAPKEQSYFFSNNNIKKGVIYNLSIGPFTLDKISVYVCDKCPNVIGSSLEKTYIVKKYSEDNIFSISLTQKKN